MKFLKFYSDVLHCKSEDEVFDYLIKTLKPTHKSWNYFVNWEKVLENTKKIEIALNTFNYLIGKDDFDKEFRYLLKQHPQIAEVIPALVVRDGDASKKFKILVDYKNKKLVYKDYDFTKKKLTNSDADEYLMFVEKTGIKDLIVNRQIKNLVDYMIGVEAGLDSNARKNRGGHAMEDIIRAFIKDISERNKYNYIEEANAEKIKREFDKNVPVDKSSRRYDFVIYNGRELFIIETNFYSGGGSKLKSTAGEYKTLYDSLRAKYKFIWITDGLGWQSTVRPLRETFDHTDHIFNLSMIEKGILEFLLK